MRVPDIQNRLRQLAREADLPELNDLADHLKRRSPKKKAAARSTRMTDAVRRGIRAFAAENPAASQVEIAQAFNINQGRVSEALRGFRK